jgi:hypothetical protein
MLIPGKQYGLPTSVPASRGTPARNIAPTNFSSYANKSRCVLKSEAAQFSIYGGISLAESHQLPFLIEIEAICRRYPLPRCDQHWTQSLLLIDYFRSDDRITPSSRRLRMIASHANTCARCGAEIEAGQRWVRAKVYEPVFAGNEPRYHRYHAEPFDGQELSCWERHLLQADRGRLAA